jgi:hypothetical protein
MRPGDIRVEPWVWRPIAVRPWSRAIALALCAVACAVTGVLVGRLSKDAPESQRPPAQTVATPNARSTSTRPEPGSGVASKQGALTLAIRGAEPGNPDANSKDAAELRQGTPHVVIINPGAADQKSRAQREPPATSGRADRNPAERPAHWPDPRSGQVRENLGSPAPNYHALRDTFLNR